MHPTSQTAISFASSPPTAASKESDIQAEPAVPTGRAQKHAPKDAPPDFAALLNALPSRAPTDTARTKADAADVPAVSPTQTEDETPQLTDTAQTDVPVIAPAKLNDTGGKITRLEPPVPQVKGATATAPLAPSEAPLQAGSSTGDAIPVPSSLQMPPATLGANSPVVQPEIATESPGNLQAGHVAAKTTPAAPQLLSGSNLLANPAQSTAGDPPAPPTRQLDPLQTDPSRITVRTGADYTISTGSEKSKPVSAVRAQDAIGSARMVPAAETTPSRSREPVPNSPPPITSVTSGPGLTAPAPPLLSAHNNATASPISDPAVSLLGVSDSVTDLSFEPARILQTTGATSTPLRADLAAHVARQIAEGVQHAPNRPIEIALSPQELGRVRVSIKTEDKNIVVNILAERGETLDLMRRHIDQLGQTFRSIGYDSISFSFGQGAQDGAQTGERTAKDETAKNRDDTISTQENVAALPPLRAATSGVDIRL